MAGLLYVRTGSGGTGPAVALPDLGITIATGIAWTLLSASSPEQPLENAGQFSARDLRDSQDLFDAIDSGALEWSKDGFFIESAASYTSDYALMQDFTDDFMDLSDGRFALPNGTALPASGIEGEVFWDSDDESMWVWDNDAQQWLLVATSSGVNNDHGNLTGLGDDDHPQYLLLSGNEARNQVTGSIDMGPSTGYFILPQATDVSGAFLAGSEGALAWDTDNDTLYAHNGTQWFAIAPASGIITDHGMLTGLLDDDHPQYGHLAQDETVSGLWTFNPSDATDPNLVLTPRASAPTTGLTDGALATVSGLVYSYDGTRSKWLSVDRKLIEAGKDGSAKDVYLRHFSVATSQTGYRALRDGTITGMFLQTDDAATWTLEVRRNGTVTVLASLASGGAAGAQSTVTNVDFSQGDELQLYANTAGATIVAPIAGIEIAWRI